MHCEFYSAIDQLNARDWDQLCPDDYPFVRHAFLAALEHSGSVSADTGWLPQHLVVRAGDTWLAALPLYLKSHSYGEYVFDWAWADAYQRHGYDYYPKLVSAIPFTPCVGPRLLHGQAPLSDALLDTVLAALSQRCAELGASGWHWLFPDTPLRQALAARTGAQRLGCQFHWSNPGYQSFADFVGRMSARKRKNIVRERRQVADQGFSFEALEGAQLEPRHWQFFHQLYQRTYWKRSGHSGYLNADFFQTLGSHLPEQVLMIVAQRAGVPVAASLFLKDRHTLYGRYWGCAQEFDFLHFETCYYQGIDYAIRHGLQRFDGGAQGEHKLARGFAPVLTYSQHWLAHADFYRAVQGFVTQEQQGVLAYAEQARAHLPFRADDVAQ